MAILLSSKTQDLLDEKLKSGQYRSADEVVQAALAALDELQAYELTPDTLNAIDRAEDQIERGEVHDWDAVKKQIQAKFLGH